MIVIIDSDGLIGSLNTHDRHYLNSQKISRKLIKNGAKLIYPATVIVETVTLLQGRLNAPKLADQILQLAKNNQLIIAVVDEKIIQEAADIMDFKKSKHNTLFDAVVATIAKKYSADAIFSFDSFYKKKGFKLASEL